MQTCKHFPIKRDQERLKHDDPDHAGLAGRADEAVVVPVPALERDEPGAADACFAKLSFQNLCSQLQYGFPNILRELMLMWSELSAVE